MASPLEPADHRRASLDSLDSVSTTSIVFDRIQEENEKMSIKSKSSKKQNRRRGGGGYADDIDIDDEDPLKRGEEEDDDSSNDLETGAFLGGGAPAAGTVPQSRLPMDKKFRRILIIVAVVFLLGWVASLAVFVAKGSYRHLSDTEHDPEADSRGSGKVVTLDQVQSGFWRAKSHSISWIADPDGQDGLLLEQEAPGKDYLVVEDVKSIGQGDEDNEGKIKTARTLIKDANFKFNDDTFRPEFVQPSPDLKKVLLGVHKQKNWRHSFTAIYYILDVDTQTVEPLIPLDPTARIQLATWNPQSDAIAYTAAVDNNLYIRRLTSRKDVSIVQVTTDGGVECFNGVPDWVYEEEVFGDRSATWWSADGRYVAYLRTNETGVPEYTLQYFVSRPSDTEPAPGEETYPELQKIKYPKAGAHNPVVELRFFDTEKSESFDANTDDQFAADDRIINSVVWAGDTQVLVKQTNRVSDILKVVLVDVSARKAKTVRTIDVGALDGGWYEISHDMTYVPADEKKGRPEAGYVDTVIHEGYDHLAYFTPLDASDPIMLTSGEWEVTDAPSAVDTVNNLVYFVAAKTSSIQRHVYSVNLLDGSNLQPLTDDKDEAYYSASFSEGAGYVLLSYSGPRIPWQRVQSTPSNKIRIHYNRTIEDNADLADRARTHALPILKYGQLDLGDGVSVNYVERRPPHFDSSSSRTYPVLFQQYSGPGSQSVNKRFAVDYSSFIASNLGYIVITVDPRGTGFRGRAHRVPVRDHLGVLEATDHIAAAAHFASQSYIDASRLCIWGWSYGGFQTLKTLEQDAGNTFSYGMAVAPVTDWRYYDSIYTERYMRLPDDNADGYDATAITNATALGQNTRFLLMHGVADDNVHFQNSLTLLDELDLAGVENYDVHVFPDSDHSIYFHNANRIVYDKLTNWLINAFNGEWLKVANPKPNGFKA
jgi:dipeptidyl aminopeptidase